MTIGIHLIKMAIHQLFFPVTNNLMQQAESEVAYFLMREGMVGVEEVEEMMGALGAIIVEMPQNCPVIGDGGYGQYGDRGGHGTFDSLPKMKLVELSACNGGRGGNGYGLGYRYDGGGGGGVLVDGNGPQIRRDTYNHESGQG